MLLYSNWNKNGHILSLVFHKPEKAAQYVINTIHTYVKSGNPRSKNKKSTLLVNHPTASISKEEKHEDLKKLEEHLEKYIKNCSIENAKVAIELYEIYMKYVIGNESIRHSLEEIKISD